MKIMTKKTIDVVGDVQCDVCNENCTPAEGYDPLFGLMRAQWGYGSHHDGETYEVHLCESCFFKR